MKREAHDYRKAEELKAARWWIRQVRRTLWPVLTWTQCEACGKEVKREYMWRMEDCSPGVGGFSDMHHFIRFLCEGCAKTHAGAVQHFCKGLVIPRLEEAMKE